jgi:hypothetical protein
MQQYFAIQSRTGQLRLVGADSGVGFQQSFDDATREHALPERHEQTEGHTFFLD